MAILTDNVVRETCSQNHRPMNKILAIFVLVIVNASALAGDFTLDPVTLSIPSGFGAPIQQQQYGATIVGFSKPRTDSRANTLLQISLYDFGPQLAGLKDSERATAAVKYLLDFVGGVERRRANFKRTEPTPLILSGAPAAKLQWTGLLEGSETVGVMYCFIVGTKVISFHTQDLGSSPTAAMNEAISAFEAVKLGKKD
ncbi:MAG: hypothetical protein LBO00_00945 [Zoogloeaceae bacterium]|jgi:hypothetical protein|nr:hypothetical protein [Zoogloeaceae bacterium]